MKFKRGFNEKIFGKNYVFDVAITLFEFRDWDDNQSEAYSDTLFGFTVVFERYEV